MINLLARDDRKQLAASRTNALILRYIFLTSAVIAVMTLEMGAVFLILHTDSTNNQAVIDENQAKAQSYTATQNQATTFRTDLSTAKYVLDNQTPYTSLILSIANALPNGARLDTLTIDPATFGTPGTLTVNTDSTDTAIDTKAALQTANMDGVTIFENVSFKSITQSTATGGARMFTAIYNITYSKGIVTQ